MTGMSRSEHVTKAAGSLDPLKRRFSPSQHDDDWQRARFGSATWERIQACYTKYFVELVLRQYPIPPSKDGRHVPLRPVHQKHLVDERTGRAYVSNSIRSSRYTIWDFLPKQFFFQATRLNNLYFIAIGIPQAIPGISTTGNYTTILPLLFFITLTVAKEGFDDYRRDRLDKVENNSFATVLRSKDRSTTVAHWLDEAGWASLKQFATTRRKKAEILEATEVKDVEEEKDLHDQYEWARVKWHDIKVGDVVRLNKNEAIPADLALLSASNENGVAYVETMALDGETNLKSKQAPLDLQQCASITGIAASESDFILEDPNRNLYDFNGRALLEKGGKTIPLTLNEVLYRGSVLRNTNQATGIVINTGEECKIRMNANHHPKAKKPRLEKTSNNIVLTLIVYVVVLSVGCSIGYLIWHQNYEANAWYLNNSNYNLFVSYRDIIIGYLIMYNNVIPLSLYISLEIVKIGQMLMTQGDLEMYDKETNTPMICNTNTILENLGQVSYILTDKTGTLTENVMKFRKMSIAGVVCSHRFSQAPVQVPDAKGADVESIAATQEPVQDGRKPSDAILVTSPTTNLVNSQPNSPRSIRSPLRIEVSPPVSPVLSQPESFRDQFSSTELLEHIQSHPESAFARTGHDFILAMALCHAALPEARSDGIVDFEAPSPDEVALVRAAHELGYTLKTRSAQAVSLLHTDSTGHQTELAYEILGLIDFSSVRKRMSIILRCPDGKIRMICKGADSVIVPRLHHASLATRKSHDIRRSRQLVRQVQRRSEHIDPRDSIGARLSMALSGRGSLDILPSPLRMTMDMRPSESATPPPMRSLDARIASTSIDILSEAKVMDESRLFTRCFQHMDDFATEGLRTLLFAQKTLSEEEFASWKQQFQDATTSLTDRQEKIEAAGELLEHNFELLGASAIEDKLQKGVPETIEKLRRANIKIWMLTGDKRETAVKIAHAARICKPLSEVFTLDVSKGCLKGQMQEISLDIQTEVNHRVAVIDGQTLAAVESDSELKKQLYMLIPLLDSVICCRASPSQKAGIVNAIRSRIPKALTLAIGDGSNDIAMIQASHVGVGISGREGLQAARVADYSIAQFRFLQRLLLVHGRWNYVRTAKFILWTFFKEFFFYMMQALYQRYDGYTGSSLYESWSLTVLNTLFTSLCVIVPGILEQDLKATTLLAVPELYMYGPSNQGLNMGKYLRWMILAAAEGIVVWFVAWAAWGKFNYSSDNGAFALGDLCFSLGIVWQNIKLLLLETQYKTVIVYASFAITFSGWWAWNAFLSAIYTSNLSPFDVRGGFMHGFGTDANWWTTFGLVLAVLVLFEVVYKASKRYVRAMLVARAWCKDGRSTASSEERSATSGSEPEKEVVVMNSGARASNWRWPWHLATTGLHMEWDVGVWQEIEAEEGMTERLLALAGEGSTDDT